MIEGSARSLKRFCLRNGNQSTSAIIFCFVWIFELLSVVKLWFMHGHRKNVKRRVRMSRDRIASKVGKDLKPNLNEVMSEHLTAKEQPTAHLLSTSHQLLKVISHLISCSQVSVT